MMDIMLIIKFAGAAVLSYLIGSIPTAYIFGKLMKGIDIRQYGSGGTGATNVLRTVGKGAAIAVLLIDLLKGLLAVLEARNVRIPKEVGPLRWIAEVRWRTIRLPQGLVQGHGGIELVKPEPPPAGDEGR
jgi:glycerol-3-phosphate acyltransferase PlsY